MSTAGEAVNVAVGTEVAAKEPSKPAEKPVKEKKTKASKEKKPRSVKNASHPPYFEMIKEALLALKEKGGSSPYAIAKYMEDKHKAVLPANFRKILGLQLKNSAYRGKLVKVKASYKLSESGKKDLATAKAPKGRPEKKRKSKQVKSGAAKGVSKGKSAKKLDAVKKTKAAAATAKPKANPVQKTKKRAPPTKAKAKQPKSIKSPAAKKAKKAVA